MKPGSLIYAVVCGVAVLYVLIANMRGYVPFVSNAAASSRGGSGGSAHYYGGNGGSGTAGHFHK